LRPSILISKIVTREVAALGVPSRILCDKDRIAQVVSNLPANALSHGAHDRPIRPEATATEETITVAVANEGE
jgi:sigma-B regulation protein RsbU (phosphoserine phosphatase)